MNVFCGRGSVLSWRCDIRIYILGFVDDVMSAHNGQA